MKKNLLHISTVLILSIFVVPTFLSTVALAQSNDQVIDSLLSKTATRGYTVSDKNAVKVISKTATMVTIEAPIAKKDGKDVTSYYITWAPISYKDITVTSNPDDLAKVKDSDSTKSLDGTPIYKIQGGKLVFTIEVLEPTKDLYVTIAPQDANGNTGEPITDFKFNINTVVTATTAVAGDSYNSSSNQAISNVTCVWDATENRTTLLWDINTAMNAKKVEISHRPDENQGDMTVKGTPDITARRFVVDTPHRNIQLFRLKPLDAAGAMLGIEIQYICKPDDISSNSPVTPMVPTDPQKPIPVTPHTGPLETTAIIFFMSLLGYFVYRKVKS